MQPYRGPQEDPDGLPAVGPGPRMLGVRPGNDPNPDVPAVDASDLVIPSEGGMSVAPGNRCFCSFMVRLWASGWSRARVVSQEGAWRRSTAQVTVSKRVSALSAARLRAA
jgi:hypothetical protein